VIVQILVAQRQAVNPLRHQLFHGVFHQKWATRVQETLYTAVAGPVYGEF
jgi:hypothetical protein